MTQHVLPALPQYPGHTVLIGWQVSPSGQENTFYASVLNMSDQDCPDDCPAHLNAPPSEQRITDAAAILALVRPYAQIPASMAAILKADQARNPSPAAAPGPLMRGSAAALHALFTQGQTSGKTQP